MDKITEVKKEMRLKEWTQMYVEYQESGKTVTEWCKERELSIKTFYYRLRKIREAALKQTEKHQIVPITTQPAMQSQNKSSCIKISGNGIMVELSENISTEMITVILRGLQKC